MVWLLEVKNSEDTFILFDRVRERNRRTDRRTLQDGIGNACIPSRGKNCYRLTLAFKYVPL